MSTFLYYLPEFQRPVVQRSDLPTELSAVLDDANWSTAKLDKGPDGKQGRMLIVAPADKTKGAIPEPATYSATLQQWAPCGDDITHWMGWSLAAPPEIGDVLRKRQVDGHKVRFADGVEWTIPAVLVPFDTLPKRWTLSGAGEPMRSIQPGYESLQTESTKWFDLISENKKFDEADWFDYVSKLLAVNYRVGPREIAALGIVDNSIDLIVGTIKASLGWHEIEAMRQKKTAE